MPSIQISNPYECAADSALCLDFANTVAWRIGGERIDSLTDYAALVAWSAKHQILSGSDKEYLLSQAQLHPKVATSTFHRAVALREVIERIFAATSRRSPVDDADITALNRELSPAMGSMNLVRDGAAFALVCTDDERDLEKMMRPIALSAAELLTSASLERVRQCADDEGNGCGDLFIDTSRNRSRRWCSMEGCGNRAKARRHYRKSQTAETAA